MFSFSVLCLQCPEAIIELYNSVLDHLGAVVSSKSLQRLSWPISEFTDDKKKENGKRAGVFRYFNDTENERTVDNSTNT